MTGPLTTLFTASSSTSTSSVTPRPATPIYLPAARGLVPRILAYLFTAGNSGEYSGLALACSYVEVYDKEIRDLLIDTSITGERTDGPEVKCVNVKDAQEAEQLYQAGARRRRQGETRQNSESSRSHAILTLHIECQHDITHRTHKAKLSLVDLAGNERTSAANSEQQRREAIGINLSLSHLIGVVQAIAKGDKHIPYLVHTLTRVVKPCLEGSAYITLIAHVSDHQPNLSDTKNTLRFAGQFKKIKPRELVAERSAVGVESGGTLAGLEDALVQLFEQQDGLQAQPKQELISQVRWLLASLGRAPAVEKKRKVDGATTEWSEMEQSIVLSTEVDAEAAQLRAALRARGVLLLQTQREMAEDKVETDEQLVMLRGTVEKQAQQMEQVELGLAYTAGLLDEAQQHAVERKKTEPPRGNKQQAAKHTSLPSGKENSDDTVPSPAKRHPSACVDLRSPLPIRNRAVKTPRSTTASVLEKPQASDRKADARGRTQITEHSASPINSPYCYSSMELDLAPYAVVRAEQEIEAAQPHWPVDMVHVTPLSSPSLIPSGAGRASAQHYRASGGPVGQQLSSINQQSTTPNQTQTAPRSAAKHKRHLAARRSRVTPAKRAKKQRPAAASLLTAQDEPPMPLPITAPLTTTSISTSSSSSSFLSPPPVFKLARGWPFVDTSRDEEDTRLLSLLPSPFCPYRLRCARHLLTQRALLVVHARAAEKTMLAASCVRLLAEKFPRARVMYIAPKLMVGRAANALREAGVQGVVVRRKVDSRQSEERVRVMSHDVFYRTCQKYQAREGNNDSNDDGDRKMDSSSTGSDDVDDEHMERHDNEERQSHHPVDDILVVDGVHKFRNASTKSAKMLVDVAARCGRVLLMTSTPDVNTTHDFAVLAALLHQQTNVSLKPLKESLDPIHWEGAESTREQHVEHRKLVAELFRCRIDFIDPASPPSKNHDVRLDMSPDYLRQYEALEAQVLDGGHAADDGDNSNSGRDVFYNVLRTKINGAGDPPIVGSGKVEKTIEMLCQHRVQTVVYSSYIKDGLAQVKKQVEKHNAEHPDESITSRLIDSHTSAANRKQFVDDYNTGRVRVLFLPRSAGDSVDLFNTRAVILLEGWWNDAPIGHRAIRLTADAPERHVDVYRLILRKPTDHMERLHQQQWQQQQQSGVAALPGKKMPDEETMAANYKAGVDAAGKQTKKRKRGGQFKAVVKRRRETKKRKVEREQIERERGITQKPLVVRDSIDMYTSEIAQQKRPPLEQFLQTLHDVRIESQACVEYVERQHAMTNRLCPSSSPPPLVSDP